MYYLIISFAVFGCANGGNQMMTQTIIKELQADDTDRQEKAVKKFGDLTAEDKQIVLSALTKGLKNKNATIRYRVVIALGFLGPEATSAIPSLYSTFKDRSEVKEIRSSACNVLARIGPESIPVLREAIKANDAFMRSWAAGALGHMAFHGNKGEVAIPILIDALGDPNSDVRGSTMGSLAESFGKRAIPQLAEGLKNHSPFIRVHCAEALAELKIANKLVFETLQLSLTANDAGVREAACRGLSNLGRKAHDAENALIRVLDDKNSDVRAMAASALEQIGAKSQKAIAKLVHCLDDDDFFVRVCAVGALHGMGPRAKSAIPRLKRLIKEDTDPWPVEAAKAALKAIQGK